MRSPQHDRMRNVGRHTSSKPQPQAAPHNNTVNYNRFHSVPVVLNPGDTPGLRSSFASSHPQATTSLLQEPFVDHRSIAAQNLLERIALLMQTKDKAFSQLNAARDDLAVRSLAVMRQSDVSMRPSMANPADTTHEGFVHNAMDELRAIHARVEELVDLHRQCAGNLKMAERELWSLYHSSELLHAAKCLDEERAEQLYLGEIGQRQQTDARRAEGANRSPSSQPLTPTAASSSPNATAQADTDAERNTIDRLNRESANVQLFDMALRVIRNPALWSKTERGREVIALMSLLQAQYRGFRARHRYASLQRARRFLDRECLSYQFFFFRTYVAALRMDRLRLKRLGFYPMLGHSNLARLRRGAFILHATRARDNATLQRVFLLWRQLTRYQKAPFSNCGGGATSSSSVVAPLHSAPSERRQSVAALGRVASRRWSHAPRSQEVASHPAAELGEQAEHHHVVLPWWQRDAPFEFDLEEWDDFLAREHLRKAMQRIALPVFGGARNHLLMSAHVLKRWRRFVTLEKTARAGWALAVRHERRQCKARHFMAWMDVVSFTAQRAAQRTAKLILYFGIWRRLVHRSCQELRAEAAMIPLKKVQLLNRWRQRVVRLRLQRAASNLLLFAYRPMVLLSVHCMLGNRQQVVNIKLWRWWRLFTQRRRMFKALVGDRWCKRTQQLSRLVFFAWRGAVRSTRIANSPNTSNHSSPTTLPAFVHPSSVLFAPQTNEFSEDVRLLRQRMSMMAMFRSYHAAVRGLDGVCPTPPTTKVVGGPRDGDDISFQWNPHDLVLPGKEVGLVPTPESLTDASSKDMERYHQWFSFHSVVIAVPLAQAVGNGDEDAGPFSWVGEATQLMQQQRSYSHCANDKHFLINVFHFALQKIKRDKQEAAFKQPSSSSGDTHVALIGSLDAAASLDATSGGIDLASTSAENNATSSTAAAARQAAALSFVLGVGYPLASVGTHEWHVTSMERAFEDYHDFNLILENKRRNRDGRIERKINMRLAAIRFAEQNPFFTCYPLSSRNIGFSPYQALMDEYESIVGGGKKRKASPKKKREGGGGERKKKVKYRIPLPPVPVRRQLPYLIRANMDLIVASEASQQRMEQQRYTRAKIQLMGVLLMLRVHHPNTVAEVARTEAAHAREALVHRYTAAEEKEFAESVVVRKMHNLVDPAVAQRVERLPIDVQVLNITGFNPKYLRGTMQQKTRQIGLVRAAMKRQGRWFHTTIQSKCTLVPTHQWALRREDIEDRIDKFGEEGGGATPPSDEEEEHRDHVLLSAETEPLRPLGLPHPERLHQAVVRPTAGDAIATEFSFGFVRAEGDDASSSGTAPDDGSDDDDESWKPKRPMSCVHLSDAFVIIERNAVWFESICGAASSCPVSPLPRELIIKVPDDVADDGEPVAVLAEEEQSVSGAAVQVEPSLADPPAAHVESSVALQPDGTAVSLNRTPLVGDEGGGFSPFGADGAAVGGELSMDMVGVPMTPVLPTPPAAGGSAPVSARSKSNLGEDDVIAGVADGALMDNFSSSDSEDDDPRMVAARQLKPVGDRGPRTLAERTKSTKSILGGESAHNLRKASIARQLLPTAPPPPEDAAPAAAERRDDDEEIVEEAKETPPQDEVQQQDATVDAFACAAMVNDGGSPNANANLDPSPVAAPPEVEEFMAEGVIKYVDGTYLIKDNCRVYPGTPTRVVLADGSTAVESLGTDAEMLACGNIQLTDGRTVPLGFAEVVGGELRLQGNCMILADGRAVRLDGRTYRIDGKVRLANGRLVDASRAAVGDDGRLMLATEKFLVQSTTRRPSTTDGASSSSDEDETALHSSVGKGTDMHKHTGGGASYRQAPGRTDSSLFHHRKAPWAGMHVPRMWSPTEGAPAVPAMERLVEISARFNGYLNGATRNEMSILKQYVLKALTKLDPDIAREEREARHAARHIASLRVSARPQNSTPCGDAQDDTSGAAVQTTEFRLATPEPPTVTIDHARRRQPAASAPPTKSTAPTHGSRVATSATRLPTATQAEQNPPQSAPLSMTNKHFIPPAVRHSNIVGGEAQMVVVDPLPVRRDGAQFVRPMETSTLDAMRSTAVLLNEATLAPLNRQAEATAAAAVGSITDFVLRRHPKKTSSTTPSEVTTTLPRARLPSKLRNSVAAVGGPHAVKQLAVDGGDLIEASPDGDRTSFTAWVASLQQQQHNFTTRAAAEDTLRTQRDVLRRRISHMEATTNTNNAVDDKEQCGRRALTKELIYRFDVLHALLEHPCPLQTTTEMFDGAIQKRSFSSSCKPIRRHTDSPGRAGTPSSSAGAGTFVQDGFLATSAAKPEPPATAEVASLPLSDAEVGRLVQFLRKANR